MDFGVRSRHGGIAALKALTCPRTPKPVLMKAPPENIDDVLHLTHA
jgi:hypothetical protein